MFILNTNLFFFFVLHCLYTLPAAVSILFYTVCFTPNGNEKSFSRMSFFLGSSETCNLKIHIFSRLSNSLPIRLAPNSNNFFFDQLCIIFLYVLEKKKNVDILYTVGGPLLLVVRQGLEDNSVSLG